MPATLIAPEKPTAAVAATGSWVWLERLGGDFRFSARTLLRAPGFSLAVILTLALCIGANTAILSTLYTLMLKPLPVPDAGQLVEIYATYPRAPFPRGGGSVPQYLNYKENAD